MARILPMILALALLPSAASAECLLCAPQAGTAAGVGSARAEVPLRIEISAGLEFSRAAAGTGGGDIEIDPDGTRRVRGDLVDLGGFTMAGEVLITGEPGRAVRVDLPREIELTAGNGERVRVVDIATTLTAAPQLDAAGRLRFRFGGRLLVRGATDGNFRGRIPITADYE